jgi:glycosyltransferase involved in cell wall biosynthesis
MRITVMCTDLGVRVPGEKGASMHLQSITSAFAGLGHDVQLIGVAGHGEPPQGLTSTHLLPHPGRAEGLQREHNKLAFVQRVVDEVGDAVRDFDPHLVYERLALFGDAGHRIAATLPGAQHLLEVNALLAEEEAQWRGLHLTNTAIATERRVLDAVDLAVAVSDEVANKIRSTAPRARCVVVENGAEVERFRVLPRRGTARRSLGLPPAAPLVCFVGALRPWHGVDVAIDAIARTPHLHLVIVGDGPVRPDLERSAELLGVAHRVHFLGHCDHSTVAAALAAADAAVAPYPALDTFSFSPLKLYEYLAAGVPVVASAIGQIPQALGDGRWGTLVPPGDSAALAAALSRVIGEPEARVRAVAGREHALAHHGWADRARRIVEHSEASRALA